MNSLVHTYKHTTCCVVRWNTAFFMHCQTGDFSAETGEFLYGILILFVGIRLDLPKCWERKRTPDSGGVRRISGAKKPEVTGIAGEVKVYYFPLTSGNFGPWCLTRNQVAFTSLVGSNFTDSANMVPNPIRFVRSIIFYIVRLIARLMECISGSCSYKVIYNWYLRCARYLCKLVNNPFWSIKSNNEMEIRTKYLLLSRLYKRSTHSRKSCSFFS